MAGPHKGHDWSRSKKSEEDEEDEEDDPVDGMLKKAGCLELHHAVQDCMAENRDWRKCQKEVAAFKDCVSGKVATATTKQKVETTTR
ncbi:cytochrome c oxidase assembly factor 4 homolog, mitochondrial-like [Asterias rubens]|uniref:cytochrome c oxidase assembly factor 4 homolog, mitochondrial-like n=1 Tax=Asterias rubens TaxID=7604 RepID=UPI0014557482|nr:cytochrome c oxidase assembly factor 4 homolog, mitochondrial-like [Asterias rubens]